MIDKNQLGFATSFPIIDLEANTPGTPSCLFVASVHTHPFVRARETWKRVLLRSRYASSTKNQNNLVFI